MDLTTAALGYGLDYAFTNMERARLGGLMGDMELSSPDVFRNNQCLGSTRSLAENVR